MRSVNIEEAYQDLANAIVEKAASDYRAALKGISKHPDNYSFQKDAKDIEHFFHSGWYGMLTKVDGDYLIRKLREEQKEDEIH